MPVRIFRYRTKIDSRKKDGNYSVTKEPRGQRKTACGQETKKGRITLFDT